MGSPTATSSTRMHAGVPPPPGSSPPTSARLPSAACRSDSIARSRASYVSARVRAEGGGVGGAGGATGRGFSRAPYVSARRTPARSGWRVCAHTYTCGRARARACVFREWWGEGGGEEGRSCPTPYGSERTQCAAPRAVRVRVRVRVVGLGLPNALVLLLAQAHPAACLTRAWAWPWWHSRPCPWPTETHKTATAHARQPPHPPTHPALPRA